MICLIVLINITTVDLITISHLLHSNLNDNSVAGCKFSQLTGHSTHLCKYLFIDVIRITSAPLHGNCSIAECMLEKSSWCQNEVELDVKNYCIFPPEVKCDELRSIVSLLRLPHFQPRP